MLSFSLVKNEKAEEMYQRFFWSTVWGNDRSPFSWGSFRERLASCAGFMIGEAVCEELEKEIAEGRDPMSISYNEVGRRVHKRFMDGGPTVDNDTTYVAMTICTSFWEYGWALFLDRAKSLEKEGCRRDEAKKYREIGENFVEKIAERWSAWGI